MKRILSAVLLLAGLAVSSVAHAQYFPQTNKITLWSVGVAQSGGGALANTAATYAANMVVAGAIQFPAAVNAPVYNLSGALVGQCSHINHAYFMSRTVGIAPNFMVLLFSKALVGTYTDSTTLNLNVADIPFARLYSDPTWTAGGTGGSFGTTIDTTQDICNATTTPSATVYGLLVTQGTYTPATTADLAGGITLQAVTE